MKYTLLLLLLCFSCSAQEKHFTLSQSPKGIIISIPPEVTYKKATLLRSYYNFTKQDTLNMYEYPITEIVIPEGTRSFTDSLVASDLTYHYLLILQSEEGRIEQLPVQQIHTLVGPRPKPADFKKKLNILVDKLHYILELRDGSKVIKRYPISLGGNPFNRKIEQDNLSTPEGVYHCNYLKPKSTFYKAIGVNYPNKTDKQRFAKAKKERTLLNSPPNIGGAIQIHGGNISSNWTWGCMAMRNDDIDELYDVKVKAYTPIFIVGTEITRDSLPY